MRTDSVKIKTIFSLLFLSIFILTPAFAKMKSINGEKVQLRSGPGTKYTAKWEYGNGFPLKVLTKKGRWVKVKDFENDTGWIFGKYLTAKPHMIVKVNKGKKQRINIRSGPGTNYKSVGQAYYGVVFETLGQKKGWAKVRHESGLIGWVKRSLLWGY